MRARVFITVALASCTSAQRLELPSIGDAKTALLVLGDPTLAPFGVAIDLTRSVSVPVTIDDHAELYVLLYAPSLSELHLAPGEIHPPAQDAPSRPFPSGATAYAYDRAMQVWSSTTASLARYRLPSVEDEECVSSGGCFRRRFGDEYCEVPCAPASWTIAEPAPPERPRFTPCPPGWSPADFACEPLPRAPDPCPAGEYADALPSGAVRVHAGAPCSPDAEPFCTIAAAVASAGSGATLALSKGTHREELPIFDPYTIIGACSAETRVALTETGTLAISGVTLIRDLLIRSRLDASHLVVASSTLAIVLEDGSSGALDQVVLGYFAASGHASVVLEDAVISGVAHACFFARGPGSVRLERVLAEHCVDDGFQILDSAVVLRDVIARNNGGSGIFVSRGTLDAARVVFLDNGKSGFASSELGAATMTDVVAIGNLDPGAGFNLNAGASVVRGYFANNGRVALLGEENVPEIVFAVEDVEVRGTFGVGIGVNGAGSFTLHRALFEDNLSAAMQIGVATTSLVEDLTANRCGGGIVQEAPMRATLSPSGILRRAKLDASVDDGLYILDSALRAEDIVISRTTPSATLMRPAAGVHIFGGTELTGFVELERFRLVENAGAGVYVAPKSAVRLRHGEITGNHTAVYAVPESFDLGSIEEDVAYRENLVNVSGP